MEVLMNTLVLSQTKAKNAIEIAKATPDKMLCIGIDIASQTHVARAVLGTNKRFKNGCSFKTSTEGFQKITGWINRLISSNNIEYSFISMEPTATYWRPVYTFMKSAFPKTGVYQVDPMAVAYSRKMHSSNMSKGDPEDAFLIAELTQNGKCRKGIQKPQICLALRELMRNKKHAVKQATIWERQLRHILENLMPGITNIIPEKCDSDVYAVFNKTTNPEKIRSLSLDKWLELNYEFKCPTTKLKQFYKLACLDIKAFEDYSFGSNNWECVWTAYKQAHYQCESFKELIINTVKKHPAFENLMTIPGLGPLTIAGFIAAVGDLNQYSNSSQIEKVFGFDLQRNQSGKKESVPKITKRGYSLGRTAMYLAAFAGCKLNAWHDYYQRKKANSGSGNKALIALAAKIARTAFQIAVNNEPFDSRKIMPVGRGQLSRSASGFSIS